MFWLTRFLVLLTLSEKSASKASSILANSETDYIRLATYTVILLQILCYLGVMDINCEHIIGCWISTNIHRFTCKCSGKTAIVCIILVSIDDITFQNYEFHFITENLLHFQKQKMYQSSPNTAFGFVQHSQGNILTVTSISYF